MTKIVQAVAVWIRYQILTTCVLLSLVMIAAMLISQSVNAAGPWYVSPAGSDANDCLTPATPCVTIGGALLKATSGDTIKVAEGVYPSACTIGSCYALAIHINIHLSGGWDLAFAKQEGESIIDGQNSFGGLAVSGGREVIVDRFVIQNGTGNPISGHLAVGVLNDSSNLTLNNCTIRNNRKGVYSFGGTTTLNHSMVLNNSDQRGGGIEAENNSTVVLFNSAIISNSAYSGGGGIAATLGSSITLNNSTVAGNLVTWGNGGGLFIENSTAYLNNSTISGNLTENGSGGGLFRHHGSLVIIQNSILAQNRAAVDGADCAGEVSSAGFNLIGDSTGCSLGASPSDLLNTNARLIPVSRQLGLVLLQEGSPAVDGGNPAGCVDHTGTPLSTDQRDMTRNGRCDIGAYEFTPVAAPSAMLYVVEDSTGQSAKVFDVFPRPLRVVALDGDYSQSTEPVNVVFSAPESGPGGIFKSNGATRSVVTTSGDGVAAAEFMANELSGTYVVTASMMNSTIAIEFSLRNLGWQPAGDFDEIISPLGTDIFPEMYKINLTAPPDDSTGKYIFASYSGQPQDHFLVSSDGGLNWRTINLPLSATSVAVAVAPRYTATHTIYVLARISLTVTNSNRWRLYKSVDAGANWTAIALPPTSDQALIRLSPNYLVDNAVFVGIYWPYAGRGGIYRTIDDGQTWIKVTPDEIGDAITDLALSPNYPGDPTMFLVNYNSGIYRSDDGGVSWIHLSEPQYSPDFRIMLSPAFAQDGTLFAVANGNSDGDAYRSADRGNTWIEIKSGLYTNILSISPRFTEDHTVIVGDNTGPLFITEDAGETWFPLRGVECIGNYGRSCDALITYQNDRLIPIASTSRRIFRYRWPTIDRVDLFFPLEPDKKDLVTQNLDLNPEQATDASWTAKVDVEWLSVTPSGGTFPNSLTLTVDPTTMLTNTVNTELEMTLHWSRYQLERVRVPVIAFVIRGRTWMPLVVRP